MEKKKQVTRIASLDALKPETIDVTIVVDDEQEYVVEMRSLSFAEWQEIGWSVPNPLPPILAAGKDGRVVYDYNDAEYKRRMAEASQQRAHKRLIASLVMDVPGKTMDEQIAYLQSLDINFIGQLMQAVEQLAVGGRARIESRAREFLGE